MSCCRTLIMAHHSSVCVAAVVAWRDQGRQRPGRPMRHQARRSQTTTIAEGDCNSELAERSSAANHRSVCVAAVGAIEDVRGRRGRCIIVLKKPTTSAVGCCNSDQVDSPNIAHHRSVCASASGVTKDGRGRGGRCFILLENNRKYLLQCK